MTKIDASAKSLRKAVREVGGGAPPHFDSMTREEILTWTRRYLTQEQRARVIKYAEELDMAAKKTTTKVTEQEQKIADDTLDVLHRLQTMYMDATPTKMSMPTAVDAMKWALEQLSHAKEVEHSQELYSKAIRELTEVFRRYHPDFPANAWPDTGRIANWAAGLIQRVEAEIQTVLKHIEHELDRDGAIDYKYVKQRFEMAFQGSWERMPKVRGPIDVRHAANIALGFGGAGYTLVSALAGAQSQQDEMRAFVVERLQSLMLDRGGEAQIQEMLVEFEAKFPVQRKET